MVFILLPAAFIFFILLILIIIMLFKLETEGLPGFITLIIMAIIAGLIYFFVLSPFLGAL
jgi:hypothetical protein